MTTRELDHSEQVPPDGDDLLPGARGVEPVAPVAPGTASDAR